MAKHYSNPGSAGRQSTAKSTPGRTTASGCGTVFRDTNPAMKDPFKEQFAPTDDYPIQQRHRMGGVS